MITLKVIAILAGIVAGLLCYGSQTVVSVDDIIIYAICASIGRLVTRTIVAIAKELQCEELTGTILHLPLPFYLSEEDVAILKRAWADAYKQDSETIQMWIGSRRVK